MDNATPNAPAAGAEGARLRGILLVLLINAVPLVGVLRYEWSAINVLVLYWFENVLVAVCTCIRIAVHRRLTRKKGYWRKSQLGIKVNDKPMQTGLLGEYAVGAFVFTGRARHLRRRDRADPAPELSGPADVAGLVRADPARRRRDRGDARRRARRPI